MRNPFKRATTVSCRGMTRAAKRRAKRTDQWWQAANAKALPYRMAKVRAYMKAAGLLKDERSEANGNETHE